SNGAHVVGSVYYAAGWMLLAVTGRLRSGEHRARVLALLASIPAVMVLWQPGAPGMDHILSVLLLAALVAWRDDFRLATPRPTRAGAWRFAVLTMAGAAVFVGYGFFALREHMVPPLDAQACVRLALGRLQGLPAPEPRWYSEGGEWFVAVLPGVVYASLLLSLGAILHAELSRNRDADKGFAG
ncbi:MAG TPA: hypothetical protein VFH88_11020, partial [Candidatus Krumholzibacteria bacterium]|nr:hypothetical protein [Candidatus Krumholzibacteria bacterium]